MRFSQHRKLIVLLFLSLRALAGDEVGGAGIAENNAMYAWNNLESFLSLCLEGTDCKLTPKELEILGKIRDAMPAEKRNKNPIVFRAEHLSPGFFLVDGLVRIAKTGYHVGDTIYLNLDLCYPQPQAASIPLLPPPDRPLDIPLAIAIIIHELGHHQGEKDHAALDVLGSKVNTAMRVFIHEVDGGPFRRDLVASSFEPHGTAAGDFIVRMAGEIRSFRSQILATFRCPKSKADSFLLWNLHWLKETRKADNDFELPLQARAIVGCGPEQESLRRELRAFISVTDGKIDPEKTYFKEIDCGKSPQLCH